MSRGTIFAVYHWFIYVDGNVLGIKDWKGTAYCACSRQGKLLKKKKLYQMKRSNYNCTEQRCTQGNALTLVNTFLISRKWAIK